MEQGVGEVNKPLAKSPAPLPLFLTSGNYTTAFTVSSVLIIRISSASIHSRFFNNNSHKYYLIHKNREYKFAHIKPDDHFVPRDEAAKQSVSHYILDTTTLS